MVVKSENFDQMRFFSADLSFFGSFFHFHIALNAPCLLVCSHSLIFLLVLLDRALIVTGTLLGFKCTERVGPEIVAVGEGDSLE